MEVKRADAFIDEGEPIRIRLLRHATLVRELSTDGDWIAVASKHEIA